MKWSAIFLCVFSLHSMMGMENDFLHQVPEVYVQKVQERIRRGTGPKKMINLVNRSCRGNLALKAYVFGETWCEWHPFAINFCADPVSFFSEIIQQAQDSHDPLALEVGRIMHTQLLAGPFGAFSLIDHAIQLDAERGLGFLIQMGKNLRPEHLSLSIQKELPHLTNFLLKAGCPVELHYTMLQDHPLVVAIQKRDEKAVRALLGRINPKAKFLYQEGEPAITLEKYLKTEELNYVSRIEDLILHERFCAELKEAHNQRA